MNIVEFFLKHNNKYLDFDGTSGPQCVDVSKAYIAQVLGGEPFKGNAIDYWNGSVPGFKRIENNGSQRPNPGDLIIWNFQPYGHIAVCNWSRSFDMGVFEQNNPIGSPCHYAIYNYKNVLGWLRPIVATPVPPNVPKVPLEVAYLGGTAGPEFNASVNFYSSNKIQFVGQEYGGSYDPGQGMITQSQAYAIVDQVKPKEKFIFIFYKPNTTSAFYASYYYPQKDCVITTCPGNEPRTLAFEFAHQVQIFYNTHRGSLPPVEVVDSMFPPDSMIKSKYDSVSKYYI